MSNELRLEDNYVPTSDTLVVFKQLMKLPVTVLYDLTLSWFAKFGGSFDGDIYLLTETLDLLIEKGVRRNVIVNRILYVYWPDGLNVFQLAEIDCHLMISKPEKFKWLPSKALRGDGKPYVVKLQPAKFIENLQTDLAKIYHCHVYMFKHPSLPVLITRIQLFDSNNLFLSTSNIGSINKESLYNKLDKFQGKPLISRRPYYVAFPLNSPIIFHSVDKDIYARLVLQSISRTISERETIIFKPVQKIPVKSIHNIMTLLGPSRFAESMGPWECYASANFERSPLHDYKKHQGLTGKKVMVREFDDSFLNDDENFYGKEEPEIRRLRLEKNMIKFKGSANGVMDQKYNDLKEFNEHVHNIRNGKKNEDSGEPVYISRYSSLVPIEKVGFTLKNEINSRIITIKLKFNGNDIFGGLHELCDKNLINIDKVPGWLAGENGSFSGTIMNGAFQREQVAKGGLL
ncbi:Chl4p [Saccharomyces cerevisiae YJM326]|nr:Chl4p [Saccharomyces cerevisiae YJM326]AJU72797.1 Chl4p [Saccharomyces cerevisiae YJM683]AJU90141.1 Chl4p [Saccharomyces cerevisiae YJM1304]CAI4351066.1 CPA_1a_G0011150.mRNA.1.CDS.1 [Saccharomyces cerevisiae]CAI4353130.1 ABA_G0011240.mRNA.1.CDS.1 [Saccharomyces cerevisiae]